MSSFDSLLDEASPPPSDNNLILPSPSATTASESHLFDHLDLPLRHLSRFKETMTMAASSQHNPETPLLPHQGSLCRGEEEDLRSCSYRIPIQEASSKHVLVFDRADFDFCSRLFCILDTESRGWVSRASVQEFVTLRCPVFWRRDEDLEPAADTTESPTFDEVWKAVATCSIQKNSRMQDENDYKYLGVEGWMVFCRFIALAQYLEAKRRFSSRHLQQTMRHRNAPQGSEVVVVDVPPLAPPTPLNAHQLAEYERTNKAALPTPELDLDHSLLAAHDIMKHKRRQDLRPPFAHTQHRRLVHTQLFGSSSTSNLEFTITLTEHPDESSIVVRRSLEDLKWLNDTFTSHKVLGGTLCGRILPPFPKGRVSTSTSEVAASSLIPSGGAVKSAAKAGVGMIKTVAKSIWNGDYYMNLQQPNPGSQGHPATTPALTTGVSTGPASSAKGAKGASSLSFALPESYYKPNSPAGKARNLERYLNYLLEHPALSTSFPLNTILKASQSGLEAAKQSLEERTRMARELKDQTPHLDDGKILIPFWPGSSSTQPNLSWVRTAAQAAIALKVHGILETTGLPSASARLQHAALPTFDHPSWVDDESDAHAVSRNEDILGLAAQIDQVGLIPNPTSNFEQGVIQVQSELEAEYDLLPLPVPAPERRILSAVGEGESAPTQTCTADGTTDEHREARFHYGSASVHVPIPLEAEGGSSSAFLGDFAVDENIDKLREVIGSLDKTLSRGLASSGGIGKARRKRLALQLDLIRGFDSWEGLRGQFVTQRSLLKGVSGLEQSRDVCEEGDLTLVDEITWQTALASSAVSAANDVRSTVRAARTAASAKAAADAAVFAAQNACEAGNFSSIDEARAAQTRSSIAQSHAIHAAVVEFEAKAVKRRATMALAHDVQCWNVHRKRELLRTCLSFARAQHEGSRRAVDAWSCLRDGYIGSSAIPSMQMAAYVPPPRKKEPARRPEPEPDEVTATIFHDLTGDESSENQPAIVATDHHVLKNLTFDFGNAKEDETPEPPSILPLVTASPIPEGEEDFAGSQIGDAFNSSLLSHSSSQSFGDGRPRRSLLSNSQSVDDASASSAFQLGSFASVDNGAGLLSPESSTSFFDAAGSGYASQGKPVEKEREVALSASMQSLVDGLMSWGGQYDSEEDFALPTGMAASIALEESGALSGSQPIV